MFMKSNNQGGPQYRQLEEEEEGKYVLNKIRSRDMMPTLGKPQNQRGTSDFAGMLANKELDNTDPETSHEMVPDDNISIEMEQANLENSGKMQSSLLNMSTPVVHCQYYGHAARHLNAFDDFILVVNAQHKVDVFKRGQNKRVKTLDIEYMRYSVKLGSRLFIGTEEKLLYLIDAVSFEILDRLQTQSYIFTLAQIDNDTVLCG